MNKDNISVAIIEPVGGYGGMNFYDFALAKGLTDAQCNVVLYTSEETNVQSGLPFCVKKHFRGVWGKSPKIIRALKLFYGLLITLFDAKKNRVVVAHYHFFHYTILEYICIRLTTIFGVIPVITAHDVESFGGRIDAVKTRKILSMARKVISHSEVGKAELISKISLPASLITVIPLGNHIDSISDLPDKNYSRARLGLGRDDKVALFFGQIKKVKGLDILLRSIKKIVKENPKFKLVIAGKVWKHDYSIYAKIIKDDGLEDNVISHIKYIPDSDINYYFQAADIIVLPYRKIYQSDVLLKAMSYKIPVLSSNVDGMTEIITDGENGFLFETESEDMLSAKLIFLLSDNSRLIKVGLNGFNTVKEKYSWDNIGRKTADVYLECVSER